MALRDLQEHVELPLGPQQPRLGQHHWQRSMSARYAAAPIHLGIDQQQLHQHELQQALPDSQRSSEYAPSFNSQPQRPAHWMPPYMQLQDGTIVALPPTAQQRPPRNFAPNFPRHHVGCTSPSTFLLGIASVRVELQGFWF